MNYILIGNQRIYLDNPSFEIDAVINCNPKIKLQNDNYIHIEHDFEKDYPRVNEFI